MRRAAVWIAPVAMIGATTGAASVELDAWVLFVALVVVYFAAGLTLGLRALWGAFALAGVLLLLVWIDRPDDPDMDVRAVAAFIALFVLVMSAAAVGIGAFVRWVAAHATSRRASD